jgi:YVTN family beta-propeller protein
LIRSGWRVRLLAAGFAILGSASYGGTALASPGGLASPAGTCTSARLSDRAYTVDFGSNDLRVFDGSPRLHAVQVIDGLKTPAAMAVGSGGRDLYIDEWGSNSVLVMDACTLRPVASIPVGGLNVITYIAAGGRSDGRYMYVGVIGYGVRVIDTTTNTIARQFPVSSLIGAIAVSPDGPQALRAHPVRYRGP